MERDRGIYVRHVEKVRQNLSESIDIPFESFYSPQVRDVWFCG